MEPIISPWWIYFANVSENISTALLLISIIGAFIVLCSVGMYIAATESVEPVKKHSKTLYRLGITFFIMLIIGCALPEKTTVYQMIAANIITEQRLTKFVHAGKLLKDELKTDLIDVIRSFGEEKKKD